MRRDGWLSPAVFIVCLLPLGWLAGKAALGELGANPIEAVIRFLGDWALRMLLAALAVTPLRHITGWAALGRVRRMVGLFAFAYVVLHLLAYIGLDQFFDWGAIGKDIVKRAYITIGMAASLLLVPLAVTSTDAMLRRLGGRKWKVLHRLVFLAVPLGVAHHAMMVKKDLTWPLIHGGVLVLLLGWRLLASWRRARHTGAVAGLP